MSVKPFLYIFIVPLVIWALDGVRIDGIFKKDSYYKARVLYLIITFTLSYLLVNFIMDFYINSRII